MQEPGKYFVGMPLVPGPGPHRNAKTVEPPMLAGVSMAVVPVDTGRSCTVLLAASDRSVAADVVTVMMPPLAAAPSEVMTVPTY